MSNKEYMRARYADRKARRVCVDCEAPTDGRIRCVDCGARQSERNTRYDRAHPEIVAARMRRVYWKDPEKSRARARQLRLEKKLRGECLKCPAPVADGSNHCAKHTASECLRQRDYNARKRSGGPLKKGGRKPGSGKVQCLSFCECGAEKAVEAEACDRCSHLEGHGSPAIVIAALRGSDGLSLRELCESLGMNTDINNGQRQMRRWVDMLLGASRIRRYWREDSSGGESTASYRNGETRKQHAIGCWAYALDGKTEREWKAAFVVCWLALVRCWCAANDSVTRRAAA